MNDELIAAAELGEEARMFIESDLGKVMLGLADQQVLAALDAMEDVDPTDTEAIRKLQNKAKMGRQFRAWLYELLDDGQNAMEVFKNGQV